MPDLRILILAVALAGCSAPDGAGTDSNALVTGLVGGLPTTGATAEGCDRNHPNWTIGLLSCTPEATPGYTLFAPLPSRTTYLIDLEGQLVHSWASNYLPGEVVYLEPNGHLLRAAEANLGSPFHGGGAGGRIEEYDWDGNLVWDFEYKGDTHLTHHDVERLPNGNLIAIAWELVDRSTAVALGRDPSLAPVGGLWVLHLIEIEPATKDIVWQWHLKDHLIQDRDPSAANYGSLADNPHLVDIDRTWGPGAGADWDHSNGVDYNADLDQIVVSAHNLDEIFIIDHATGDIVYRWGTPANYGMSGPQMLSGQHDVEWIPEGHPGAGNLLIFNNGNAWGYSRVFEIETPVQPDGSYARDPGQPWGPAEPTWSHGEPGGFFSGFVSGSQRLPSGNTLICDGDSGRFTEVTPDGDVVWEYVNPVGQAGPREQGHVFGEGFANSVFRADRYPLDYPAFEGRDLTPQGRIER